MTDTDVDLKNYQHASDRGGGEVVMRHDRDWVEGVHQMSNRCIQRERERER